MLHDSGRSVSRRRQSNMVKRIIIAGMLWFAPGWCVPVFAHGTSDRDAPAAISRPAAAAPFSAAPLHPSAHEAGAAAGSEISAGHGDHAAHGAHDDQAAEHEGAMTMRNP